jgi:hypothetical protein
VYIRTQAEPINVMRLQECARISTNDLKNWVTFSLMALGFMLVSIFTWGYQHNKSVEAYILIIFMFFSCFYSQGFLAGIAVTRCINVHNKQDYDEEEGMGDVKR